jgi:hypothetical protein
MTLVIILLVLGYAALAVGLYIIRRRAQQSGALRLWEAQTWR